MDKIGDLNYIIIDTRSPAEYHGKKIKGEDLRGGHIPGSISIDAQEAQWQDKKLKKIKSAAELTALYQAEGITRDMSQKLIVICRTTRRTTYSYFALRLIGFEPEQIIMADEAYIYWNNDFSYPLEEETFVAS